MNLRKKFRGLGCDVSLLNWLFQLTLLICMPLWFIVMSSARTQEYKGRKWVVTPGGQALWLFCLECHQKKWPEDVGQSIGAVGKTRWFAWKIRKALENIRMLLCCYEVGLFYWAGDLYICALLADAARTGGSLTGTASLLPSVLLRGTGTGPCGRTAPGYTWPVLLRRLGIENRSNINHCFAPDVVNSGTFRFAWSAAEKEEVAAPGMETSKDGLGCGNTNMMRQTWGHRQDFHVKLCKDVALLGSFYLLISERVILVCEWTWEETETLRCIVSKGESSCLR